MAKLFCWLFKATMANISACYDSGTALIGTAAERRKKATPLAISSKIMARHVEAVYFRTMLPYHVIQPAAVP